jgi:hypothetical protein
MAVTRAFADISSRSVAELAEGASGSGTSPTPTGAGA